MLDAWFKKPTTTIQAVERDAVAQQRVDQQTAGLALYHYDSCMFCARVRKAIGALQLNIELRDIMNEREHYRDLATHGGRTTVPCLRIDKDAADSTWMFESADIIDWLVEQFANDSSASTA